MTNDPRNVEIKSCCPWSLEILTYSGFCSHNALKGIVKGRFHLTSEELELVASRADDNERGKKGAIGTRFNLQLKKTCVHPGRTCA